MTLLGYDGDVVRIPFSAETRANLELIFNDKFMQTYTNCNSFEEFMFSSAVIVNWDDKILVYSRSRFDTFVTEVSGFKTWDEMLHKGAEIFEAEGGEDS
ncbi:hypothetical protein AGMMS49983_20960 [Clostridia bacterium]|nr:hypothetical protein AGMMS49983_20960 [Clostridia bacterium]